MQILDPGHRYLLDSYDGGKPVELTFVKRNNPPSKYPDNENAHPGTTFQEVLRAMIERGNYVNNQLPAPETESAISLMRQALKRSLSLFLYE